MNENDDASRPPASESAPPRSEHPAAGLAIGAAMLGFIFALMVVAYLLRE